MKIMMKQAGAGVSIKGAYASAISLIQNLIFHLRTEREGVFNKMHTYFLLAKQIVCIALRFLNAYT